MESRAAIRWLQQKKRKGKTKWRFLLERSRGMARYRRTTLPFFFCFLVPRRPQIARRQRRVFLFFSSKSAVKILRLNRFGSRSPFNIPRPRRRCSFVFVFQRFCWLVLVFFGANDPHTQTTTTTTTTTAGAAEVVP